jgi:hypothetical protein
MVSLMASPSFNQNRTCVRPYLLINARYKHTTPVSLVCQYHINLAKKQLTVVPACELQHRDITSHQIYHNNVNHFATMSKTTKILVSITCGSLYCVLSHWQIWYDTNMQFICRKHGQLVKPSFSKLRRWICMIISQTKGMFIFNILTYHNFIKMYGLKQVNLWVKLIDCFCWCQCNSSVQMNNIS